MSYKNKFEGERVFFIGNGPSLSETPLHLLNSEHTFAVNKIYKKFGQTDWIPDIYLLVHSAERFSRWDDRKKAIEAINEMANKGVLCFLYSELKEIISTHPNISYLERSDLNNTLFAEFDIDSLADIDHRLLYEFWSNDIELLVYAYHSAYVMYQICSHLGFDEIILVGCDLGFEYINPHMIFDNGLDPFRFQGGKIEYIKQAIDEDVLKESLVNAAAMKIIETTNSINSNITHIEYITDKFEPNEKDHFINNYWDRGLHIKDNKKLERQILREHAVAKELCYDNNIDIYNGTIGGELEVFPRVDITEVIDSQMGDYNTTKNNQGINK